MLTLPDGVTQASEGMHRCPDCGGEVVWGWEPTGGYVNLTPCLGERHDCETWQNLLETLWEAP